MKLTAAPTHCGVFEVKEAAGPLTTLMFLHCVSKHPIDGFDIVNWICLFPAVEYVTVGGLAPVKFAGVAPAPKFHE